ncbi:MAG: hypothetical protein Edafosvirus28_5 [Edafosvirus sp.]|uniref:Uncharacterized protein n=1 Tax=Edafosvirus sp. TaxID=2487765 RepID=A0A3G4ZV04_9VIRU|nr:MAG: hypothetical protein Edafosvirus28_5 [Edafosvirus sp.]
MLTTRSITEKRPVSNIEDLSVEQQQQLDNNTQQIIKEEINEIEQDNNEIKKKKINEVINTFQQDKIFADIPLNTEKDNDLPDSQIGSILISYSEKKNKFSFFNSKQQTLGSFSIKQLIKYIGNFVDSYEQFMRNVKLETSVYVINTFMCTIDYSNNNINIILYDHIKSPFMGNIELLIKLNNGLRDFQKTNLNNELEKVDKKFKKKIISAINQFIYMLLNHTQKIIAIACEKVNSDNSYEGIREGLMKYSIGSVYRISQFVKEQLNVHMQNYEELNNYMNKTKELKISISNKMDKMNQLLEEQNKKINIIVDKIEENNKNKLVEQAGGNDYDSDYSDDDHDEDQINEFNINSHSSEQNSQSDLDEKKKKNNINVNTDTYTYSISSDISNEDNKSD